MKHYETTAGYVNRGDTFAQINEKLIETEELCTVMGHLHKLQDNPRDDLLGTGWLGIAQLIAKMRAQVITLAQGHMQ
jgi:hypothetical protein